MESPALYELDRYCMALLAEKCEAEMPILLFLLWFSRIQSTVSGRGSKEEWAGREK
jgi:hypothetical protein